MRTESQPIAPTGKLIIIEGLDGSGKNTQAKLLAQTLKTAGKPVRMVSFPDYDSASSALVKMYLSGEFGTQPDDVNAYAASTFFAVDRYASWKRDWGSFYKNGGIIVADRYTTSNAVHQCCKLPSEQWEGYLNWLFSFEYDLLGLPAPDLVIYLQVDVGDTQKLMDKRYHSDENRKDIHEGNLEYLAHAREAAEYCATKLGWKTVHCHANGVMRSIEAIHKKVIQAVEESVECS